MGGADEGDHRTTSRRRKWSPVERLVRSMGADAVWVRLRLQGRSPIRHDEALGRNDTSFAR
ncbi:MAG: hypothetical protein Q8S73_28940 [Deltaproteobacteria bacterium]|nr:hypothetical protein [Deltaproteobacteria bacterium]